MKADYKQGKLYLFYEDEYERAKLFNFIKEFMLTKRPAEIGLLESTDSNDLIWGMYVRALIKDDLAYLGTITTAMKKAREQFNET